MDDAIIKFDEIKALALVAYQEAGAQYPEIAASNFAQRFTADGAQRSREFIEEKLKIWAKPVKKAAPKPTHSQVPPGMDPRDWRDDNDEF